MNQELKVRVTLETEGAKKQVDDLKGRAEKAAGGIGGSIGGSLAAKLGMGPMARMAAMAGGVYAAAKSPILNPTLGGAGDLMGEAFGGYGAQLENFAFQGMAGEARASASAREATIGAFAAMAGRNGAIPAQAESYFKQVRALSADQEKGRNMIEGDSRFRTEAPEMLQKMGETIGGKLAEFMGDFVTRLQMVMGG